MMPKLDFVVDIFANNSTYEVWLVQEEVKAFDIIASIQQLNEFQVQKMGDFYKGKSVIRVNVNEKQPLLELENTHGIIFNNKLWIIHGVLDKRLTGHIVYTAVNNAEPYVSSL